MCKSLSALRITDGDLTALNLTHDFCFCWSIGYLICSFHFSVNRDHFSFEKIPTVLFYDSFHLCFPRNIHSSNYLHIHYFSGLSSELVKSEIFFLMYLQIIEELQLTSQMLSPSWCHYNKPYFQISLPNLIFDPCPQPPIVIGHQPLSNSALKYFSNLTYLHLHFHCLSLSSHYCLLIHSPWLLSIPPNSSALCTQLWWKHLPNANLSM